MKIFVVGMPQSGRTTVSKALAKDLDYRYIDASSWVKSTFRDQLPSEHPQQYHDELHSWLTHRMKVNPSFIKDNICDSINTYGEDSNNFVIDGIFSPKDLVQLFDYNKDFIVFLNRTGNQAEYKDYESIGVSVMRDYCFWLSSADLIPRERWFEYNFSIPGENLDWVKSLGHKNSVYIVKSINKVISHLKENILNLQAPQS
jgi:hypothetical protein